MKLIIALVAVLLVATIVVLAALSATPAITMEAPVKAVGASTPVKVEVTGPYGLRRFTAALEQNGARYIVYEHRNPARRLLFVRLREAPHSIIFPAGKQQAPALRPGKATLVVEAQSNDFLARTTSASFDLNVVLEPPRLAPIARNRKRY